MAADQPLLPLAHVVFRLRGDRPLLYQQYRPIEADLLYYVRYQTVSDVLNWTSKLTDTLSAVMQPVRADDESSAT